MPGSPTSEHESDFVCARGQSSGLDGTGEQVYLQLKGVSVGTSTDESILLACNGEPRYKEYEGRHYCVLHFPGKEKSGIFYKSVQRKLENEDFNFHGVWFPDPVRLVNFDFNKAVDFRFAVFSADADFRSTTFGADADFSEVTFKGKAKFGRYTSARVDFNEVTFKGKTKFSGASFGGKADFSEARFGAEADFSAARFGAAVDFSSAAFSAMVDFSSASFIGDADFIDCTLSGKTNFRDVTFRERVNFAGDIFSDASALNLEFATIEKPDHVSFYTITLRPHWFVNVDGSKFEFTDVKWRFGTTQEIKDLRWLSYELRETAHQLLAIAFRRLSVNAENNHRYEEASRFRYMAMDVRQRRLALWRLSWWYWLASGYGERVLKAFVVLLGIGFVAGLLYTQVGFARWEPRLTSEADVTISKRDDMGAPLPLKRALTYSLGVLTFQRPEPRPATTAAHTVVLLETILGPIQAALLALAIRRKFMR